MPTQQQLNTDSGTDAGVLVSRAGSQAGMGRRWGQRVLLGCLVMSLAMVTGCGSSPDTATSPPAPTASPETAVEATPESPAESPAPDQTQTIAPAPTPAITSAPNTTATAPKSAPAAGEKLPNALMKDWEPESAVLFEFGQMTVMINKVEWNSGQSSPYTVISSTDGGYLLKLESPPSFFDIPHPYIKLIPKTDDSGAVTSIEVAFYDSEAAAQNDQYVMFGSYFTQ